MGWSNPPRPWGQMERILSGRPVPDGGDAPGWSRKRAPYRPVVPVVPAPDPVPYAELHAHSSYSFLDGASEPQAMVEEAVRLGLRAMALVDHDGFYGAVRFAEAAAAHDLRTVFGAELSLRLSTPQAGVPDPGGEHLLALARGPAGYRRLCEAITAGQLAGSKGAPRYDREALVETLRDHVLVLTGCRKGSVRAALTGRRAGYTGGGLDIPAGERALRELIDDFGRDAVVVELSHQGLPEDDAVIDALGRIADRVGVPTVATTGAHAASPADIPLAEVVAAVRARRSIEELHGWLAPPPVLRSGAEMRDRFGAGPVARTVEIAEEIGFALHKVAPHLPRQVVPEGRTAISWLRELVARRLPERYPQADQRHRDRIEHELAIIEDLDFPGYFIIVHDIAAFAASRGILHQGRGSAASSAVCYVLGVTAIDPIYYDLPFERFLSPSRDEPPDIDIDFDSARREEVIQWVYRTYGRHNAAQVANVITYRPRSAIRDVAKALGHSTGQQDAWSKQLDGWVAVEHSPDLDAPAMVRRLSSSLTSAPRHLGIHSGGMVLTDEPVSTVCPVEPARMADRTVLQWDKDDCAWMGLVKFDLLGLGMLGGIQHTFDHVAHHLGERWELATIPADEPGVYDMLCRADSVGVFQVESRAQIGTLPRLQPRCFYDLVIEIALIRPGPIQGDAVHPYIRRRTGAEPVTYPHPRLVPVLERTLGIPLFQEQLMQMAIAVSDFTADEADRLRKAMGSKRGVQRIDELRDRLYAGMARHGITGADADRLYEKIAAFANFGFAESHALSFGLLVYASSWLKLHYPAAFLAGLLQAQPMGFYSPASLVADATRRGVAVRRPDILRSSVHADLEPVCDGESVTSTGMAQCCRAEQPSPGRFDRQAPDRTGEHRRDGRLAVRLGLTSVTGIETETATAIVTERQAHGRFTDLVDLARRVELSAAQLEALATAGAFDDAFDLPRRTALWGAGQAARERPGQLEQVRTTLTEPDLPAMTPVEETVADLWSTGIPTSAHPLAHARGFLTSMSVLSIAELADVESGRRIRVGGLVTHRQRPTTAGGVTFLNLEDETGMLNVICTASVYDRCRPVSRTASAMVVRGVLERREGVTNLLADRLEMLPIAGKVTTRNFR